MLYLAALHFKVIYIYATTHFEKGVFTTQLNLL